MISEMEFTTKLRQTSTRPSSNRSSTMIINEEEEKYVYYNNIIICIIFNIKIKQELYNQECLFYCVTVLGMEERVINLLSAGWDLTRFIKRLEKECINFKTQQPDIFSRNILTPAGKYSNTFLHCQSVNKYIILFLIGFDLGLNSLFNLKS